MTACNLNGSENARLLSNILSDVRLKARAMTIRSQSANEKWEILIEKLEDLKLMASEALEELRQELAVAKESEDRVEAWLQSVFDDVSFTHD